MARVFAPLSMHRSWPSAIGRMHRQNRRQGRLRQSRMRRITRSRSQAGWDCLRVGEDCLLGIPRQYYRHLPKRRHTEGDPEGTIDHSNSLATIEEWNNEEDDNEYGRDYCSCDEGIQALDPDEGVEACKVPFWKCDLSS